LFPAFPNSITTLGIDPNPYNCLPNYISAMSAADLAKPLCTAGNTNGCAVAGIKQYDINNDVSVYPNPASSIIHVELNMQNTLYNAHCTLYDINGRAVKQSIIYNLKFLIDVSDISEGVYQLSIQNSDFRITKRVVIVR
jgi:hypothetical protein